jgi:hypothetical protein
MKANCKVKKNKGEDKGIKGECFKYRKRGYMTHDCKEKKTGKKDKKFDTFKSDKSKSRRSHSPESPTLLVFNTYLVRDEDVWYLNSSATRHVTPHKDWFIEYTLMSSGKSVLIEDDHKCEIKGVETIPIIFDNGKYKHIHKVFHVLEMAKNLLLAQEFRKGGLGIHLAKEILLKTKKETRLQILLWLMAFLRLVNIHQMIGLWLQIY